MLCGDELSDYLSDDEENETTEKSFIRRFIPEGRNIVFLIEYFGEKQEEPFLMLLKKKISR